MVQKKIYFAGSIRGGREDAQLYKLIIDYLSQYGKVLTEHVGYHDPSQSGDEQLNDPQIYSRDIEWLLSCDAIVAEITTVSMGVGFELGQAVAMGKKILCLYRPQSGRRLSAMIAGCPGIMIVNYSLPEEALLAAGQFLNPDF